MATDIRCTPSGQAATALIRFPATSFGSISAGFPTSATLTDTESSMPAYSALTVSS